MITPSMTSYLDDLVYVGSLGCLVPSNSSRYASDSSIASLGKIVVAT